jgi:hypothetical protein
MFALFCCVYLILRHEILPSSQPQPKVFGRLRRRRSLISAQGWSASDNPGITALLGLNNAESVGQLANSFRVETHLGTFPRVVAALQP